MPQLLRHAADRRTVGYMLLTTALLLVQWNLPSFHPALFVLCLFMAVSVSVIAHNHNHLPIWRHRSMNIVMDFWITLFYGFPTFAWIPTHNANHHKFNNREGDYTITYRVSEKNNLLTLVSYPSVSSYYQQRPIRDYLSGLWRRDRTRFWLAISQYGVLILFYAGALWLDWKKALLFIIIPDQVSLFSVLIFNYVQHVHADEESRYDHSRNFTGILNAMLFNNGFHTIHHEHPGIHWSKARAAHQEIERNIAPALMERSFWWYLIRAYVIGALIPRFGTKSMRLRRQAASLA